MFATTAKFLPQHRAQRQQLIQNQQVLSNLDNVIIAQADDEPQTSEQMSEQVTEEVADAG